MIGPEDVDSDGYLDRLTEGDESRFREVYQEQHDELDIEASKAAVRATLRNKHEPHHEVLGAIADGFHPYNEEGMETGYEVALSNPLYEVEATAADLLLTAQDYQEVHLCFVACESAGEDYVRWGRHINEISDLYRGHEEKLLEQFPVEGLDMGHVQFVTATMKEDLPDVDLKYLKSTVSPDNYAIWVVDDDYEGNGDRQVELRNEFGHLAHRQLRTVLEDGFDYGKGESTDLGCTLNSHEFVMLRETFLRLMLQQYSDKREEPREFNQRDFEKTLVSHTQIGDPPEEKTQLMRSRAANLLEVADDAEMLYSGGHRNINTNRDYRLRFPSGMPTQVPEHIRPKYIEYRAPWKMAEDAYERAREEFEPIDQLETELDDTDSWGKGS
jgi:hypothetical protein